MSEHLSPPPPPPERRRFLKWVTHGLGALFGAVIGVPAVAYLIDPRNRPARSGDFKPVGKLSELEKDRPKQAVVLDVRRDAWTVHPNDVIGRVWLVRREGDKVDAFTTICPHLGCSINHNANQKMFVCPCHNGTFELSGEKRKYAADGKTESPVPRDMDSLEVNLVQDPADPKDKIIEVKYQNFYQGQHDKVAKK
jgi:menaquinol-cytochrome c reductase iron-sulfur subunit